DAVLLEELRRTDPRQLQDLRRADRSGGEDDALLRAHRALALPFDHDLDADGALAPFLLADAQRLHVRLGHHREVGALHRLAQPRLGGAPAHALPLVHVEVGVAEVVAAVELVDLRDADLFRGITPGVEDLPLHARLFHAELA